MPYSNSALLDFYDRVEIDFITGSGSYLYSESGDRYLDMAAGYAANSFGYSHPQLIDVLTQQANRFWHLCNRYKIPKTIDFCNLLVQYSGLDKVYPCNTGAEGVESAIKFARHYFYSRNIKKHRFITIESAFHGRTLAAASAGAASKMAGYGPPVDGFDRVPFDDIKALEAAIKEDTAGVLLEPIQGEGGIRPNSMEYLQSVRQICDKHDMLLLFDEVQCGMGRTGKIFAANYYNVKPDILILGKGLGGGFPVAAVVMRESIANLLEKGSHGSTFGGNPIAIAIATKVLEMMGEAKFLSSVRNISEYFLQQLNKIATSFPDKIELVRGVGLMLGIKLKPDYEVDEISSHLREKFILTIPASDNTLRITPPLIIGKEQVDEFIAAFEEVLNQI